ncbi:MAG: DUF6311 domain-containing protein, partial [Bacteroidota bacterium]
MTSFILQFFWGAKLSLLFTKNSYFCAVCAGILFMICPPLTNRIHGHFALTGHWIVLAAIWSYFRINLSNESRWISVLTLQLLITVLASGIHPYIAAMMFPILIASYLDQLFKKMIKPVKAWSSILLLLLALLGGWYFFGYLPSPPSDGINGYGLYSLNLNGLIDPSIHSSFLDPLPRPRNSEALSYLGLGIILLLISNLICSIATRKGIGIIKAIKGFIKEYPFLCIFILCITLFSLSYRVYLNDIKLLEYPLPFFMHSIAGAFRASTRFFWPVYYLIVLCVLVTSFKFYSRRHLRIILSLVICIQFLDLLPLHFNATKWMKLNFDNKLLQSSAWSNLHEKHNKLIVLPSYQCRPQDKYWPWFEALAASQGLQTNSVYLARQSKLFRHKHCVELPEQVENDQLENDAAYVFFQTADFIDTVSRILGDDNHSHYCTDVDGVILCRKRTSSFEQGNVSFDFLSYALNSELDFTDADPEQIQRRYQSGDWSSSEKRGTWTDGKQVSLLMIIDEPITGDLVLEAKLNAFLSDEDSRRFVNVLVNGEQITQWVFQETELSEQFEQVVIPAELVNRKVPLEITFNILNPVSPKSLGLSDDTRELGLKF